MVRPAPLNNIDHAGLRVRTERRAELGDNVMLAPVYLHEFRRVQAHYPIVFTREGEGRRLRPIALFGLEHGMNLFLTDDGWDAPYVPIRMRLAPFLVGREGGGGLSVHIDLDHPRVSEFEGDPLFLVQGGYAPILQEASGTLSEAHSGEQQLHAFTAMLDELGLTEPFTLEIKLADGTQGQLAGFETVAEETLQALDGVTLERLSRSGYLISLFMVTASLAQFTTLIARRNALCGGAG